MKGNPYRTRMKSKTVHGVRTGQHNNPHVMKAAARADGGVCDGETKMGHLGRMGRIRPKKENGGAVGGLDLAAGGRGLQALAGLGMPSGGPAPAAAAPGSPQDDISGAQRLGQGLMAASRMGMRNNGGIVAPDEEPKPSDSVVGGGGRLMGRGMTRRADGGVTGTMERDTDAERAPEELQDRLKNARGSAGAGALSSVGGAVKKADGGPLSTKERNALPTKDFAVPGRRYPINDASHARNALSRVAQNGNPTEKAEVRSAVSKKFPGIGQKKADGGEVSDSTVGSRELKQHALEHKALAEKKGD